MAIDLDPLSFPCDFDLLGIPHFWNVATNVPFVVVGILGLRRARRIEQATGAPAAGWRAFWWSTLILGFASGAYHWAPTNLTLAVDRVFVSAMAASVAYRAAIAAPGATVRWRVLGAFLLFTELPVLAWWIGGLSSVVYGLTQLVLSIYVVLRYVALGRASDGHLSLKPIGGFIALYAGAKLMEAFDGAICDALGCIGGHPFKHVLAALGAAWLLPFMAQEMAYLNGRGAPAPDA